MPEALEDVVAALRGVEIFAGLENPVLEHLARAARTVHVCAGDIIYREGDAARSLAVVRTGRLVALMGAHGETATELTAGAVLGELGVLSEGKRSATVRALRDSDLIEIDATAFLPLLSAEPDVALALARTLAARLQRSRDAVPPPSRTSVITIVATIPDVGWSAIIDQLIGELGRRENVHTLEPPPSPSDDTDAETRLAERLHAAEHAGGLTILLVSDPSIDPAWTRFCLRSADRVILYTRDGVLGPGVDGDNLLRGCDVLFVGDASLGNVATCLARVQPRAHHFVRDDSSVVQIGRLARRVTGHAIGLVLSGGGARGLAHVGVMAALEAADLKPDRVGGTSMGALIGALAAKGWSATRMRDALEAALVHRHPYNDFTVPRRSMIRGHKARAMLEELLGSGSVEHLELSYFAVSADLWSGERVVHRSGNLCEAVTATMAVPGLVPPVVAGGRLLVDGGVIDNLPVDVMAADGEGPVIAIDVMRHADHQAGVRSSRHGGSLRSAPPIVETLVRASLLGSWERAETNRSRADLVVTPEVQDIGLLAFDRLDEAMAAGSRAMSAALRDGEFLRTAGL